MLSSEENQLRATHEVFIHLLDETSTQFGVSEIFEKRTIGFGPSGGERSGDAGA